MRPKVVVSTWGVQGCLLVRLCKSFDFKMFVCFYNISELQSIYNNCKLSTIKLIIPFLLRRQSTNNGDYEVYEQLWVSLDIARTTILLPSKAIFSSFRFQQWLSKLYRHYFSNKSICNRIAVHLQFHFSNKIFNYRLYHW